MWRGLIILGEGFGMCGDLDGFGGWLKVAELGRRIV